MAELSPITRSARGMTMFLALVGVAVAGVGGFIMAAAESDGATLAGMFVVGLGGLFVSIATVAWGVRLGVESVEGRHLSGTPKT